MLSKKRRIKKKKEFEDVFKKGDKFASALFTIRVQKNTLSFSRFAFASPSKVFRKAVERNRARRIMRGLVEELFESIKEGLDIIFIAKRDIIKASHEEAKKDMEEIIKNSGIKND